MNKQTKTKRDYVLRVYEIAEYLVSQGFLTWYDVDTLESANDFRIIIRSKKRNLILVFNADHQPVPFNISITRAQVDAHVVYEQLNFNGLLPINVVKQDNFYFKIKPIYFAGQ